MARQRTTFTPTGKPQKPYPGYPLFPHATRRWAKKIKGKLYYFGSWDEGAAAALERYELQREDLENGRPVRPRGDQRATLQAVCESFLEAAKNRVEVGKITQRSWSDYKNRLIAEPHYGTEFVRPSRKEMRINKAQRGGKHYSAAELRAILGQAGVPLRAMILLAINAAFGPHDCGTLRFEYLDLDGG